MGSGAAEHGDEQSDLADFGVCGAAAAWPPAGWVTEVGAAKRMGISDATLRRWLREGRFGYAGERVQAPTKQWWRLYAVAEVDRAYRAMKRDEGDAVDSIDAANVWPPAGFVDGYEVARLCGVDRRTIEVWAGCGRLNGGGLAKKPGERVRAIVFPEAEVRRLVDEVRAEAEASFPPAGFVDRYHAAALFGVKPAQFNIWLRQGRIRCTGRTVRGPGGGPAKIYAVADLERAREEMAAEDAAAKRPPEGFLDRDGATAFFGVHTFTLEKWQRALRCSGVVSCPGVLWRDLTASPAAGRSPTRRGCGPKRALDWRHEMRPFMSAEATDGPNTRGDCECTCEL